MDGFKSYDVNVRDIKVLHVGQVPEGAPEGTKQTKAACENPKCGRKVRYLFETPKGQKVCANCLKIVGYTQAEIDKMYNVAYFDGKTGSRAVKASPEEKAEALTEMF